MDHFHSVIVVFIVLVGCLAWGVASTPVTMALNPNSSLYTDIKTIVHFPLKGEVVIALREQRRCQNPSFIVRLSGKSLYMMNMEWHPYTKLYGYKTPNKFFKPRPNIYTFYHPLMEDKGDYFVEVLVLFCGSFDPNSYKDLCVESPHDKVNIVTLPYKFAITSATSVEPTRPRWVWQNTSTPTLLATRYQTRNCGEGAYCEANEKELAQHRQYAWVGQPDWRALLPTVLSKADASGNTKPEARINVCFVGSSHEREMAEHGRELNGTAQITFTHILSTHPQHFDLSKLHKHHCHYAIIGYGQWPVSFVEEYPYSQEHFTAAMGDVFVQISGKNYTHSTQIFVQSVNYNALGALMTCCSPIDHRTPPVIDMLNNVLRTLCDKYRIPFLDMHHIMGPLWDSAEDWSHPRGSLFNAEVEFALHKMFSSSIKNKKYPF